MSYHTGELPDLIAIPIEAGYDNTLLHHFGGSVSKVKDYISGVTELSRPHFTGNNSLPFKIILSRPHFTGNNYLPFKIIFKRTSQISNVGFGTKADDLCISPGQDFPLKLDELIKNRKKIKKNIPLVIFTEDFCSGTVGCAGLGRACGATTDGQNLAIVDMHGKEKSYQQVKQASALGDDVLSKV